MPAHTDRNQSVAVLIPCYNEATTIGKVVQDMARALPQATIYVYDNASSDDTPAIALRAGAQVGRENRRGKGHVIRRMFSDIEADLYVLIDGDGTYDAAQAPLLIKALTDHQADMVVGTRRHIARDAGRRGHALGNRWFNRLFRWLFTNDFSDIFSGYRVFTRRFVKSFPAISGGFETETEMAVHAAQLMIPCVEIALPYGRRPSGSHSKLHSLRDGWKILKTFIILLKETRPDLYFGLFGAMAALSSLVLGLPVVETYHQTGLVPRLPTAVLAASLMIIAALLWMCGIILASLTRSRIERHRINFLSIPRSPLTLTTLKRDVEKPRQKRPGQKPGSAKRRSGAQLSGRRKKT